MWPLRRPVVSMVTDRRRYRARTDQDRIERLIEDAARAARAGVDLIQVRERGLDDRTLLALVRRIGTACAGSRAILLVNGRSDIALAAAAGGVHLPASSPSASRVREIVPSGFVIGRSVHRAAEARAGEQTGGSDYLIFGTVYPSAGKPAGHPSSGPEALRRVCHAVRLPVLAIGGVVPARAHEIAAAGAAGIAAIGMFVTTEQDGGEDADQTIAASVAAVRRAFEAVSSEA